VTAITAVKQFLTYVNGAPFQPAIAAGLRLPDSFFTEAAATLRAKRDLLSSGLEAAGFDVFAPHGSYFVVADAAPHGYTDSVAVCRELPHQAGVVANPQTALCGARMRREAASLVRFAYCKRVDVLGRAAEQLAALAR
jgi:N-succinyldiaminopimelate aminotransferase